jgi:hypothetical protein
MYCVFSITVAYGRVAPGGRERCSKWAGRVRKPETVHALPFHRGSAEDLDACSEPAACLGYAGGLATQRNPMWFEDVSMACPWRAAGR